MSACAECGREIEGVPYTFDRWKICGSCLELLTRGMARVSLAVARRRNLDQERI